MPFRAEDASFWSEYRVFLEKFAWICYIIDRIIRFYGGVWEPLRGGDFFRVGKVRKEADLFVILPPVCSSGGLLFVRAKSRQKHAQGRQVVGS